LKQLGTKHPLKPSQKDFSEATQLLKWCFINQESDRVDFAKMAKPNSQKGINLFYFSIKKEKVQFKGRKKQLHSQALAVNASLKLSLLRLKKALSPISLNATLPNNPKLILKN
jgi:hypothetical protein